MFEVSAHVPALTVQFEVRLPRAPDMVSTPPVEVVKARFKLRRLPESVTVVV